MLEGEPTDPREPADESTINGEPPDRRSLVDDIEALYEDGRTYAEAELAYQATRARLVGSLGKAGASYGLLALLVLHMALVGLTVGAILSLAPLVGPFAATAIVVVFLLLVSGGLAMAAKARFRRIAASFERRDR